MVKYIRKKTAKKVYRRRRYGRKRTAIKYPDGLNVRLQHNDCTILNTTGQAPTAFGSGVLINPIPGAVTGGVTLNDLTGAMLFRLRDSLQWSQFSTLYDRIKFNSVKVQFIPQWNTGFAASAPNFGSPAATSIWGTSLIPTMKFVHDYDDANPPPTVNSIWARRGRVFRLNKPFSITIKPRMRTGVLNVPQGGGSSIIPAVSVKPQYLDMASAADVGFFGGKFAIKDWNGAADMRLQVVITYSVSLKNMLYNGAPPKGEVLTETFDLLPEEEVPCEDQVPKP